MSEVIVITSGKGGVGKTTTTANMVTGLALAGAQGGTDRYRYRSEKSRIVMGLWKQDCIGPCRCCRRKLSCEAGAYQGQALMKGSICCPAAQTKGPSRGEFPNR
jgi:hypothetical protein